MRLSQRFTLYSLFSAINKSRFKLKFKKTFNDLKNNGESSKQKLNNGWLKATESYTMLVVQFSFHSLFSRLPPTVEAASCSTNFDNYSFILCLFTNKQKPVHLFIRWWSVRECTQADKSENLIFFCQISSMKIWINGLKMWKKLVIINQLHLDTIYAK